MAIDKATALNIIEERFGSIPSDAELLLDQSAARDCTTGDVAYRPYYVLSMLMGSQWNQYVRAQSASGASVEWDDGATARRYLMDLQRGFDVDLCDVPDGGGSASTDRFEVVF